MLERLNENTQKVTTADHTNRTVREGGSVGRSAECFIEENDADTPADANSYHNPFATSGLVDHNKYHVNVQKSMAQPSTSNMKQSMDRMRYFARPSGVKHLMDMVDEIVDEFSN